MVTAADILAIVALWRVVNDKAGEHGVSLDEVTRERLSQIAEKAYSGFLPEHLDDWRLIGAIASAYRTAVQNLRPVGGSIGTVTEACMRVSDAADKRVAQGY